VLVHGEPDLWFLGCRCATCHEGCRRRNRVRRRLRRRREACLRSAGLPHGTVTGHTQWGCPCEACAAAYLSRCKLKNRERNKRARLVLLQQTDRIVHGTRAGYRDFNCRCAPCKAANSAYYEMAREEAREEDRIPHGTVTGYSNWGCRCVPCKAANSEYQAERSRRRREAIASGKTELPHGTNLRYRTNCRCKVCLAAVPHGTQSGRWHWGCRCALCDGIAHPSASEGPHCESCASSGERLRRLRRSASLSQEAVAKQLGVHPTRVSDIERGRPHGADDLRARLTELLGGAAANEPPPIAG